MPHRQRDSCKYQKETGEEGERASEKRRAVHDRKNWIRFCFIFLYILSMILREFFFCYSASTLMWWLLSCRPLKRPKKKKKNGSNSIFNIESISFFISIVAFDKIKNSNEIFSFVFSVAFYFCFFEKHLTFQRHSDAQNVNENVGDLVWSWVHCLFHY